MNKTNIIKKILIFIVIVFICFILIGCAASGTKAYDRHSQLIQIDGYDDLYYYESTKIIYIAFNEFSSSVGYGYMAPYYSENGKLCKYDIENKIIKEIY